MAGALRFFATERAETRVTTFYSRVQFRYFEFAQLPQRRGTRRLNVHATKSGDRPLTLARTTAK